LLLLTKDNLNERFKKLKRDKRKFLNKIINLKKEFADDWFFVLTNRNLYDNYKKFGKIMTKKSIANSIKQIFKKNEK
jgi:hypothetical protein